MAVFFFWSILIFLDKLYAKTFQLQKKMFLSLFQEYLRDKYENNSEVEIKRICSTRAYIQALIIIHY